jgi:hypothetical protein
MRDRASQHQVTHQGYPKQRSSSRGAVGASDLPDSEAAADDICRQQTRCELSELNYDVDTLIKLLRELSTILCWKQQRSRMSAELARCCMTPGTLPL